MILRPFLMFGGHSFNENPPYFAYTDFSTCSFRIWYQKYTFPSTKACLLKFFPRLKLALGVLTSVEQLVPLGRPPGFPEVPRGLGSSPVWMYGRLDVWTFRRMDV